MDPELISLCKEFGALGVLCYLLIRHAVPALDRLTAAVQGARASNDHQHAVTQQRLEGACRAPGATRTVPVGLGALFLALGLSLGLGGCSSVHDSAVMFRDDLRTVRDLSEPRENVGRDAYDAAWDALEDHASALEERTR